MRDIKFCIGVKNEAGEVSEVILTIDELLDKGLKCEDCEILYKRQFTGLKDYNGVEIYEGDILHALDPTVFKAMTVSFADGAFVIYAAERWEVRLHREFIAKNELVIIGNIHQAPELLK